MYGGGLRLKGRIGEKERSQKELVLALGERKHRGELTPPRLRRSRGVLKKEEPIKYLHRKSSDSRSGGNSEGKPYFDNGPEARSLGEGKDPEIADSVKAFTKFPGFLEVELHQGRWTEKKKPPKEVGH